jgi:hypothetical protein
MMNSVTSDPVHRAGDAILQIFMVHYAWPILWLTIAFGVAAIAREILKLYVRRAFRKFKGKAPRCRS